MIAEVYHIDARAKKQKMTPAQRLVCHKEHSKPLMTGLKSWLDRQMDIWWSRTPGLARPSPIC
ncbi:MAG: hypothetical protein A2277_21170 [Desulfobacterales bacterium RIFOXYA12_FULL_46_15]|nr:MAG: hypothetical protein A2277_21170 [Desulfobacterales bacterium RIFOXYA12_FULL_46_15]